MTDEQIPKQLHITPPKAPTPAYPLYFLGPYLNIKQAVQTYLNEKWKREQYLLSHPDSPPSPRALSRITTSKVLGKNDRERERTTGPNFHLTITGQVEKLGLGEFEGQQHSGIHVSDHELAPNVYELIAGRDECCSSTDGSWRPRCAH